MEDVLKRMDKVEKRLDTVVANFQETVNLKDWRIQRLEKEIVKMSRAIDAIYRHNEAARAAVERHYGTRHGAIVRELIAKESADA
jgi:exonuclease VII small subunit